MSYNELLNNIKPYVKNIKNNIGESKNIEENLKNVEKDIKEYEGLGELGKSELAKANNKKSSLEANKKKLENKSINELASAKKLIKSERRMYESKVKGYTNALNYRENTIKRCKDQMLQLKKDGKAAKYTATNEYVKKVIEEKKQIARKRTEVINEFKEEKTKLDNLESLLAISKIEALEKEVDKGITKTEPTGPTVTEPTGPVVTEPTGPAVTEPTGPAVTEPTEPVVTEPTGPVVTEPTGPVVTEPTEPVVTEPTEPVVTEPTGPAVTEPTEPVVTEPTNPKKDNWLTDQEKLDLISQIAEKQKTGMRDIAEEIKGLANEKNASYDEALDNLAQLYGVKALDIKEVTIDDIDYEVTFGSLGLVRTYKIGEENEADKLKIDLSRKSEAQYKETIKKQFPESEECIDKLDVGIIQIYMKAKRTDLVETYIDSIYEGEKTGDLPKVTYDLFQAKGYSRNESVVRRNARNNKAVADVRGMTKNIFVGLFDSLRDFGSNIAVGVDKLRHKEEWNEEIELLEFGMRRMLRAGRKDAAKEFRTGKEAEVAIKNAVVEVGKSAGERAQENAEPVILNNNEKNQENDGEEITNI